MIFICILDASMTTATGGYFGARPEGTNAEFHFSNDSNEQASPSVSNTNVGPT